MNRQQLTSKLDLLPSVQQRFMHFCLRHGAEIPFLSVRLLAQKANVAPSTIMRTIRSLEIESYGELQDFFRAEYVAQKIGVSKLPRTEQEIVFQSSIASVFAPENQKSIHRIADKIFQSPILVAGFRSSYSLAYYFAYLMGMVKYPCTLVPNYESATYDQISIVSQDHHLLVFASHPYSSQSVKLSQFAEEMGLAVIAITDSDQSPLIPLASDSIVVDQIQMTYFPSQISFFSVIEYLIEIGCGKQDRRIRKNLKLFKQNIEKRSGYWVPNPHLQSIPSPEGSS